MATTLDQLVDIAKKSSDNVNALTKRLDTIETALSKQRDPSQPSPHQVLGAPWARIGEDSMSSRGFSFMKMLGLITGAIPPEEAKQEIDIHRRLHKCYVEDGGGYEMKGMGRDGINRFLAPLSTKFMEEKAVPRQFRQEMRAMVHAGVDGADWDEMKWVKQKSLMAQGYSQKALSWLNEFSGGSLVAPPEMGELIELLRNKEALVNAGARTVPLPPQGRLKFPRQTYASSTYWVGENSPITESQIGTGEMTLSAKKLAVLIKTPNELIRFASPATEALIRDDMTKSLALGLDLACLEGSGTDTRPRGLINMPNINRVNSSKQTADGDYLVGEDIYRCIAAIEESNAEMEGWIMRPKTWYKYLQLRADAVAQGDRQGLFLFNAIREPGENSAPMLGGFPVTKSTQVNQFQTKGSNSNLTYIVWGMWSDFLIGMFGAIEFAATTQGDTAFVNDSTWIRGILSADCNARHEVSFGLMSNLGVQPPF